MSFTGNVLLQQLLNDITKWFLASFVTNCFFIPVVLSLFSSSFFICVRVSLSFLFLIFSTILYYSPLAFKGIVLLSQMQNDIKKGFLVCCAVDCYIREYWRGKYQCTIDLLFDWFGLVCFTNRNKNFQLSYSRFQTSQTEGQQYCDTFPFSIPWLYYHHVSPFLFLCLLISLSLSLSPLHSCFFCIMS